jgi:hypothetical protein
MAAGTLLATPNGWRAARSLSPGDLLLTLDGGTMPVLGVEHHALWDAPEAAPAKLWPYHVPRGAIGNTSPLHLLQGQHVLFEEAVALDLFGVYSVAVPVTELEGYFGIRRQPPDGAISAVTLHMEQTEVLLAEGGTMLLCPAQSPAALELSEAQEVIYPVLLPAHCQSLLDELEEQGGAGAAAAAAPDDPDAMLDEVARYAALA